MVHHLQWSAICHSSSSSVQKTQGSAYICTFSSICYFQPSSQLTCNCCNCCWKFKKHKFHESLSDGKSKGFSVSKSFLGYWIVRNGETRCESVSVLAVWWMRWTSPQWSWMKHSGNFRPISVSKEKPRKWSGSLKLLGMMRNKSLGHQKPAALQSHCRTGELGHIQVTFLIIFSVLMSYKHFQICLVWGGLLRME